jgi:signal peptidase II
LILNQPLGRALAVAAAVFLVDRAVKIWIVEGLDLATRLRIEVADPWLNLTMAWNHGINFGLFDQGPAGRWWLIGIALVIVAVLLVWVRRSGGWATPIGVGAVVGGALGNVWDRVQWGAVADFLNMSCCGIDNPFAFNVADAAIFLGAAILILFGGENAGDAERRRSRKGA